MTVLKLISSWTDDERLRHADIISECLKREQTLSKLKAMRTSEEELQKTLARLSGSLSELYQNVRASAERLQELYLRISKTGGNA